MLCPTAACLALGLQAIASVNAELSAGLIPARADADSRQPASMAQTLQPSIGVVEPTPRGPRFSAAYSPRAFWRYPNSLELNRPALLHGFALLYQPVLEPRTAFGLSSRVQYGEADYTAVQEVFGEDQTVAPDDPFVRIFSASLTLSLSRQLSRRWGLATALPLSYQTGFSEGRANGSSARDTQSLGLLPTLTYALTPRDRLGFAAGATFTHFEASDQLASRTSLAWSHEASQQLSLSTSAGVGRLDITRTDDAAADLTGGTEPQYFAIGGFGLTHRRQSGSEALSLGVDARADSVVQTTRPRATLAASVSQAISRRLALGAALAGFTAVDSQPLPSNPNETGANARLTLSWTKQPFVLRGGVRGGIQGPHLAQRFETRQVEAVGFVGLTWVLLD